MWTGIGITVIVCVLGWALIRWLIQMVYYVSISNKGIPKTRKQLYEQIGSNINKNVCKIMSDEFRQQKIHEYPQNIFVGGTKIKSIKYKNYHPYEYIKEIRPEIYVCNETKNLECLKKDGEITRDIYQYFENIVFVGSKSWQECRFNYRTTLEDDYRRLVKMQCHTYCTNISNLVCRYINNIANEDFTYWFIQVLVKDRKLVLDFIRECYAADEWRKQYAQVEDCENYLQDFMEEKQIAKKIRMLKGSNVDIPTDLRWRKRNSSSLIMADYIKKINEIPEAQETSLKSKLKAQYGFRFFGAITLVELCLFIVILSETYNEHSTSILWSCFFGILLCWCAVGIYALFQQDASKGYIAKTKIDAKEYEIQFMLQTNLSGQEYGDKISSKIKVLLDKDPQYSYYT